MASETCEYHTILVADIAVIKNDLQYIKDKLCGHVEEGDKQGGFRDRLIVLEQSVSALKRAMWIRVCVAGVIGGLIGSGSTDAVIALVKWITK